MEKIIIFLEILRKYAHNSKIKVNRSFRDFLGDRITQCISQPNIMLFFERLSSLLDVDMQYIEESKRILHINNYSSSILAWIRQYTTMVVMLATQKQEEFDNNKPMLGELKLEADEDCGCAISIPEYTVPIKATLLSNLAHGGDHKAGNATLFRRMQVLTTKNKIIELPFFAGNALRGTLRDLLADHFLGMLGLKPSRITPPIELWFFQTLYSGGMLEGKKEGIKQAAKKKATTQKEEEILSFEDVSAILLGENEESKEEKKPSVNKSKILDNKLGANGSVKIAGNNELKSMIPMISILGSALVNRIVPGKINVADIVPECKEWGFGNSTLTVNDILEWAFLTRRDDLESRPEGENASMIANTECLKRGTVLHGGFDYSGQMSEIEESCLMMSLLLLKNKGYLGAESRRGFGKIALEYKETISPMLYETHVRNNARVIKDYLIELGAMK